MIESFIKFCEEHDHGFEVKKKFKGRRGVKGHYEWRVRIGFGNCLGKGLKLDEAIENCLKAYSESATVAKKT